jgi:prenyltransferase beta subunit
MRGRTNKLVDGCYSFWQGGLCRLLTDRIKDERCDQTGKK